MPPASLVNSDLTVARHRQRRREQGLQRVELTVHEQDAVLLRSVAAALSDPERAAEARSILLTRFAPAPDRGLKELLASAPLDDIDLERSRDTGRDIDF